MGLSGDEGGFDSMLGSCLSEPHCLNGPFLCGGALYRGGSEDCNLLPILDEGAVRSGRPRGAPFVS